MHSQASENYQKTKIKCLKEGDQCSKFFHSITTTNKNKKIIIKRLVDCIGNIVTDSNDLQDEAVDCYTELFNNKEIYTSFPNETYLKKILFEQARHRLDEDITDEEIIMQSFRLMTITSQDQMDLGPKKKIKLHWDMIKQELKEAVKGIFATGLVVNEQKSKLFLSKGANMKSSIMDILQI